MNIIITGMTGSGKSTIGKMLSKRLNLEFIDLDSYIEKNTGLKISEIFSLYGEDYFRKLEKKACKEAL